jgi:methionyl-tRNA formyltransferase
MIRTFGLYLSSKRGLITLEKLLKNIQCEHIGFIVSTRDVNVERDYYDEIRDLSTQAGLAFYEKKVPLSGKADVHLAVGWRTLIPKDENTPLIVVHDSVLPKYRGFNPLVTALIEGDKILGATAFLATEAYDEGDIIAQRQMQVEYPIKATVAIDLVAPLVGELCVEMLQEILVSQKISSVAQDHSAATYSLWRDEQDYKIDWTRASDWLKRFIDAVGYPFKGAYTRCGPLEFRVLDAEIVPDVHVHDRASNIGKVLFVNNGFPVIVCGSGLIRITELIDEKTKGSALPLKRFRTRLN